jgi:hypothetical protein
MVIKQLIEPDLDPIFLPDSYGYRPGKSALEAVGVTRKRCWKYDWVLEFDIKGLFDNIAIGAKPRAWGYRVLPNARDQANNANKMLGLAPIRRGAGVL